MADTKYAVVRLDRMSGTYDGSKLLSAKYYENDKAADIQNGSVVHITDELLDREVFKVIAPTADDTKATIGLVASVELIKDSCCIVTAIDEFVNKADGESQRVYRLETGDIFSVTAEAINGSPTKGGYVKLGTTVKWEAATAADGAIGSIIDTEIVGGKTYYVIVIK